LHTPEKRSRELDAGVIVGDTFYIFEFVSVERPLDYVNLG
jgi:hypothetical protein